MSASGGTEDKAKAKAKATGKNENEAKDEDKTKDETIRFVCDGRTIHARAGQSIAAALWAHGDRVLSRSTKYHRPKGWACGTGDCANCTMRVDGLPNVRTCMREAKQGTIVEGQNAWPSVRHDLFRLNDLVFRKGIDHHHGFVRPRALYPLFGHVIRAFAGWGRKPDDAPPAPRTETRRVDVIVAGGGPAGLAAATAAGQAGAQVLLIDPHHETGGIPSWTRRPLDDPDADPPGSGKKTTGAQLAARWREEAHATGRVVFMTRSALAGIYPYQVHMIRGQGLITLAKSDATVITTGALANEGSFEGNDLPGVMSATGCLALLNREGAMPGERAIVHGAGAHGLSTALELHEAGVEVVAVTENAPQAPGPRSLIDELENRGIPLWTHTRILQAHGGRHVRKVSLMGPEGRTRLKADLIVVAQGSKTLPFAMQGLGARLTHEPQRGGTVPVLDDHMMTSVPGLFAAGDAAGIGTIVTARATGRLAGLFAARHAGHHHGELETEQARLHRILNQHGQGPMLSNARRGLNDLGADPQPGSKATARDRQTEVYR